MKETKRKAFNFLRSYFDVFNELEKDKDKLDFLTSIINKQFLDEDPKDLNFIVNLCYQSQRHQIESSVKGWERASKDTLLTTPTTTLPTTPTTTYVTNPKEEEEEEEEKEERDISSPTEKTNINFKDLLEFINLKTQREFKVINDSVKAKYKARIKEGYTKQDILNAITNACNDEYHKENNFKYLKPEYFSRANTLDLHAFKKQKPIQNYSNENPYKKDLEAIENNRKEYLKTL